MIEGWLPRTAWQAVCFGVAVILGLLAFAAAFQALRVWLQRARSGDPGSGRGDWEKALAGYKNLRDQGVLSEEEYRKIRTLVEPHIQGPQSIEQAFERPVPPMGGAGGEPGRPSVLP